MDNQSNELNRVLGRIEGQLDGLTQEVRTLREDINRDIEQNRESLQRQIDRLKVRADEHEKGMVQRDRERKAQTIQTIIAVASTGAMLVAAWALWG